jgi:hypothetical protein
MDRGGISLFMQRSTWTLYPLWSDTRHLFDTWEKNRAPEFNTFPPGTEYNFARNSFFPQVWRLRAHHFFPLVKERPWGIRHQCYWLQINIIHVELVLWTFLETDMAQLPINHQHTSYIYRMKLSVHCAFEAGFWQQITRQEFDKNENNQYPGIRWIYGA